tara:strand:+ start:364 stop:696 length:333 start_codon:yes stop_codon:yes gene_type:complete
MSTIFDPNTAVEIDQCISAEDTQWKTDYEVLCIALLNSKATVTGDEFRVNAIKEGLGNPHCRDVWGGMVIKLKKAGYIQAIGKSKPTYPQSSHNETVTMWKSLIYKEVLQ